MFMCFIVGGFSILFSIYVHFFVQDFIINYGNETTANFSSFYNYSFNNSFGPPRERPDPISFARFFTFSNNVTILVSGIILILAGLTIHSLTTIKRAQAVIKRTTDTLLLPDEKIILDIIIKNNGEITQKELTNLSSFSKVRVFRVTKSLEEKGLIDKKEYGQTRKIILRNE